MKSIFNLDNSSFRKLTKYRSFFKYYFRSTFPWWIRHISFQLETHLNLYVLLLLCSLSFMGFTSIVWPVYFATILRIIKVKIVQPLSKIFVKNFYARNVFSSQLAMESVSSFPGLIHSQMWPLSLFKLAKTYIMRHDPWFMLYANIFWYVFTFNSVLVIPKSLESDWTTLSIKCCIPNIGFIDISGHWNGLIIQLGWLF